MTAPTQEVYRAVPDIRTSIFPVTNYSRLMRIRLRDEAAWSELENLYGGVLGAVVRNIWRTATSHDVEEVVRIVFSEAFKGFDRYDENKGRFHHWLAGIAANQTRKAMTKALRYQGRINDEADLTNVATSQRDPSQELDVALLSGIISQAIARVRERTSAQAVDIFLARVRQGRSIEEIAEEQGTTVTRVYEAVGRVKKMLRHELAAFDLD